jgi:hypothetical protein
LFQYKHVNAVLDDPPFFLQIAYATVKFPLRTTSAISF